MMNDDVAVIVSSCEYRFCFSMVFSPLYLTFRALPSKTITNEKPGGPSGSLEAAKKSLA